MFEQRALRSATFWLTAALAIVSELITAAIVVRIETTWLPRTYAHGTAIAAVVLTLLTLPNLVAALATRRHATTRAYLTTFYAFAIALYLIAAVLSIYILAWMFAAGSEGSISTVSAGIAFWIIGLLSQTAFYAYVAWPPKQANEIVATPESTERPSPARSAKRAISVHLAHLKPPPAPFFRSTSEPYSPTYSGYSSSPRSSFRDSFNQVIRPMTSKTRLIRHSFLSQDARSYRSGRPVSFDTMRHDDEFAAWDTSATVEEMDEGDASPRVPTGPRSRLETIPGSRPVSPAKPLDGPFPAPLSPETPLPDSPMQSPTVETGSLQDFPTSPLRRPSTHRTHQSHIHPLFRPESPMPPPMPSPGTVITASPLAGQIVSPEQALSPRRLASAQSMRSGAASPLSPTASRAGSVKSFRMQSPTPTSPVEPVPTSPTLNTPKNDSTTQLIT